MPGLSDVAKTALLRLIFQNTAWANVGDASGLQPSGTAGNLYVSLHTADPTDAGNQGSSEAAYTNYARVAVARSGAAWTIVGVDTVQNAALVAFPTCGATGATITHFAIGTAASGAGSIVGVGTCSLAVTQNITPEFGVGALTAVAS